MRLDSLRRRMSKKRTKSKNKPPMAPPMLIPAIAVSARDDLGVLMPAPEAVLVVEVETGVAAEIAEGRSGGEVVGNSLGVSEVVVSNGVGVGNGDDDVSTGAPSFEVTLREDEGEGDAVFVLGAGEPSPGAILEQLLSGWSHASTRQQPLKIGQL